MSHLRNNGSTARWRQIRKAVLARDMNCCTNCGRDDLPLSIDHILERAKGGTDEMSNLQTLCELCHKNKTRFFCKKKTPPPIPVLFLSKKGQIGANNSHMSILSGDEAFRGLDE